MAQKDKIVPNVCDKNTYFCFTVKLIVAEEVSVEWTRPSAAMM